MTSLAVLQNLDVQVAPETMLTLKAAEENLVFHLDVAISILL